MKVLHVELGKHSSLIILIQPLFCEDVYLVVHSYHSALHIYTIPFIHTSQRSSSFIDYRET